MARPERRIFPRRIGKCLLVFIPVFVLALVALGTFTDGTPKDRPSMAEDDESSLPHLFHAVDSKQVLAATSCTLPRDTEQGSGLASGRGQIRNINGVIVVLSGGQEPFFLSSMLPRLDQYLLSYYPYPLVVFHQGMPAEKKKLVVSQVPHAPYVHFEDISSIWDETPPGVESEEQIQAWMRTSQQRGLQGRGYRIMCRFWARLIWRLPVMQDFEYYLRLDTDSFFTKPVSVDPFGALIDNNCAYGYFYLRRDSVRAVHNLWKTVEAWAEKEMESGNVAKEEWDRVENFALDDYIVKDTPHFSREALAGKLNHREGGDTTSDAVSTNPLVVWNVSSTGLRYSLHATVQSSSIIAPGEIKGEGSGAACTISTPPTAKPASFPVDSAKSVYVKDNVSNPLSAARGVYQGRMYFNNFEVGTLALKQHPLYESLVNYLDTQPPYGIMQYRWGDAPIHSLGIELVLAREKSWHKCYYPASQYGGYVHGRREKIPPL